MILLSKQHTDIRCKWIRKLAVLFRSLRCKRNMICQRKQHLMIDLLKHVLCFFNDLSCCLNKLRADSIDRFQNRLLLPSCDKRIYFGSGKFLDLFCRFLSKSHTVSEKDNLLPCLNMIHKNPIIIQNFNDSIHPPGASLSFS